MGKVRVKWAKMERRIVADGWQSRKCMLYD
jgi:hypothetical protein